MKPILISQSMRIDNHEDYTRWHAAVIDGIAHVPTRMLGCAEIVSRPTLTLDPGSYLPCPIHWNSTSIQHSPCNSNCNAANGLRQKAGATTAASHTERLPASFLPVMLILQWALVATAFLLACQNNKMAYWPLLLYSVILLCDGVRRLRRVRSKQSSV